MPTIIALLNATHDECESDARAAAAFNPTTAEDYCHVRRIVGSG
jgi:hypothetical protein